MIDIVIPVQRETKLLDACIASIEEYTTDYVLHVVIDDSINVSEARQKAMDTLPLGRYVCFLDDDSIMIHHGWLPKLVEAVQSREDIIIAFAEEDWGAFGPLRTYHGLQRVSYGPAACMLLDIGKLPVGFRWDPWIGLRTGWLGGDFEEVEYAFRLAQSGLTCVGVEGSRFLHTDRPMLGKFCETDRARTSEIMLGLQHCKHLCDPRPDFFRKMVYVKADPNNDRMLAPGKTLKDCFNGVIKDNRIEHFPMFKRWGLV